MIEAQIISKVLDEQNFYVLQKFGVEVSDFPTLGKAYAFIKEYVHDNKTVPDYRTVVAEFDNFDYSPEVTDTFKYLCAKLKAQTAKRRAFELLQHQASKKFSELSGDKFIQWLKAETEKIERQTLSNNDLGTDWSRNGAERLEWYQDAKNSRTFQFIPTPYPKLTECLGGGFELGDYILLMAFTNRGKSWIASHIGVTAWQNNFTVLHYSPELSKRQQALRLDTLIGHFDNTKLRRGSLDNEEQYSNWLGAFNPEMGTAKYIIKTMEDLPDGLTLEAIETDLNMYSGINMVIIDGFNLMNHGKGKMRDGMTLTSRRLRQIFGRYKVAGLVVHQTPGSAERENGKTDDDGNRVVSPPKLTDYSETIAVIQDSATALTFDAHDGTGKLSIEKAREPKVGELIELTCNFNFGYITEEDTTSIF